MDTTGGRLPTEAFCDKMQATSTYIWKYDAAASNNDPELVIFATDGAGTLDETLSIAPFCKNNIGVQCQRNVPKEDSYKSRKEMKFGYLQQYYE